MLFALLAVVGAVFLAPYLLLLAVIGWLVNHPFAATWIGVFILGGIIGLVVSAWERRHPSPPDEAS